MEATIKTLISSDTNPKQVKEALQLFVDSAVQVFSFPELDNKEVRKQLWETLYNVANTTTDNSVLKNCFVAIRILSREKSCLNELVTSEWLSLIQHHSGLADADFTFEDDSIEIAVEVGKCLCNIVFNSKVAAKMCCQNNIIEQLMKRLKSFEEKKIPREIVFFDVKLVFLLTALCSEIRNKVRDDMDGVTSLTKILDKILKETGEQALQGKIEFEGEKVDLVCEVLKALFNLTIFYGCTNDEQENSQCEHLVELIRLYLLLPTNSKEKSLALKNNLVNLLTNIPTDYYKYLLIEVQEDQKHSNKLQFEGQNMTAIYEILVFLKNKLSIDEGVTKKYEILCPVLTVLLNGAKDNRAIRKFLRLQILPPLTDVHTRPEQGETLRNYLCRLLTTPITQLRDLVADLLFILCKKSVKRMIKYTGYGNAAGLFAQKGLLGGKPDKGEADFSSDSEDSETEEYAKYKHGINPVIGCYEEPHSSAMENMTEEQKEYEAMKLVELIDNLTKCGAIRPCRVGQDGKPHPIDHVLQLQEGLKFQQIHQDSEDSD